MVKGAKKKGREVEKTEDVCRFFLNGGKCRFGERCRNRHVTEDLSSEGADREALSTISQYLANMGMIATEAAKINEALKKIEELEKKNEEMVKKNQAMEKEIEESKGKMLCRVCFDEKELSEFWSFKCGHCYCFTCLKSILSHNLYAMHINANLTCPTCSKLCEKSDLRKLY